MVVLQRPNLRQDKVGVVVELMPTKVEFLEPILSVKALGRPIRHGEAHRFTP